MKRVVLVTGGSRGIGRATVYEFAKRGYDVAINYVRNDKKANEICDIIKKEFGI